MSTKAVIRNAALTAVLGLAPLAHAQLLGGGAGGGLAGGLGTNGIDGAMIGGGELHGQLRPRHDIAQGLRGTKQTVQRTRTHASGMARGAARTAIGTAGQLDPQLPSPRVAADGGGSGAAGAAITPDAVMLDAAGAAHGGASASTGLGGVDEAAQPVAVSADSSDAGGSSAQP